MQQSPLSNLAALLAGLLASGDDGLVNLLDTGEVAQRILAGDDAGFCAEVTSQLWCEKRPLFFGPSARRDIVDRFELPLRTKLVALEPCLSAWPDGQELPAIRFFRVEPDGIYFVGLDDRQPAGV